MERIIEVCGLKKWYKTKKAIDEISFSVEKGAMFSLLGENGAGKSTTLAIIGTLLKPDGGKVTISGHTLGKENQGIRAYRSCVSGKSDGL